MPPPLLRMVADDRTVHGDHQLVAPARIRSDALALLFAAAQRGDLAGKTALEYHERLTGLKMRLLADRVSRRTAWTLVTEHGWESTADAEYLAVTQLQADALITIDPVARGQGGRCGVDGTVRRPVPARGVRRSQDPSRRRLR